MAKFDIKAALTNEVGSYEKTEWTGKIGGIELTLYSKPLSPHDLDTVTKFDKGFMQNPTAGGMVKLITTKATDEDGNKVFDKDAEIILKRCRVELITDIFTALFGGEELTVEEAEKN